MTYIIAEIGSNHDGDLARALQLIELAKEAGADAAKFQSFQAETLLNERNELLERLALPEEWHVQLRDHAAKVGIDFLSTPFDLERLQLLLDLDIPKIKIASGDLTYLELVGAASVKPLILSTGHATLEEVEQAMKVIKGEVTLLHCVSLYPTPYVQANLRAMVTLKEHFQVPVGLSDHSPGSTVALGAVALGACVIEKHFTDDPSRVGPDHPFAMNPEAFKAMVTEIRHLEEALGSGEKRPAEDEKEERIHARRALYAKVALEKGTVLSREMVKVVRRALPKGIPANQLEEALGKELNMEVAANQLLTWGHLR